MNQHLATLTKKKREKIQISKIINKKGDIKSNAIEIQRIIRGYYEQLYTNKLDNLEEMEKFLETYNLPRVNQKEIENLNRTITSKEIESVIKYFPMKKSLRSDGFTGEFYQIFKEKWTEILLKICKILKSSEPSQTHYTRSALS